MISTPICDFVRDYAASGTLRLHMPGHKGRPVLGVEHLDITEIDGADDLYHATGIIAESEANASALFGCPTWYSAEGSSLCIRAMLFLAARKNRRILAGRNAHKSLMYAAALLDLQIDWLYPSTGASYLSCPITAADVEAALARSADKPCAVYLTSPDYLGNTLDIGGIAAVCHRHGVLLLVDNAHGAYLKFLSPSRHPMDLGADMCCDSAHKTLPVLTGGAYLHIAPALEANYGSRVKDAMALFGSTSPSYLILQSLDAANPYLADLAPRLADFLPHVEAVKTALTENGYTLLGDEPLKLTLSTKAYGYCGEDFSAALRRKGIVCEFSDPDFVVLMLTPENSPEDLARLQEAMLAIPRREAIAPVSLPTPRPRQVLSLREAIFSRQESLPVAQCRGRILAAAGVSCPPAIPIVLCGEEIDDAAIALLGYYGIAHCKVIVES